METMQQIRNAHRASLVTKVYKTHTSETGETYKTKHKTRKPGQSLKAFAREHGVISIVERAHANASKTRAATTKERTRASIQARREKKSKKAA